MPIIERLDAVCGGWDRIGGSAWIELQNGRNLSKYSIESDVKIQYCKGILSLQNLLHVASSEAALRCTM